VAKDATTNVTRVGIEQNHCRQKTAFFIKTIKVLIGHLVFVMLQSCYYVARVFHISTLSVLSGLRVTKTATALPEPEQLPATRKVTVNYNSSICPN